MKKVLTASLFLFLILFAVHDYSLGESTPKKDSPPIVIYKGEIKTIPVDTPTKIVISNPIIADVTSVSKSEIVISAKEAGESSFIWWDAQGEHDSQLRVFPENMLPIKERIENILKAMNLPNVVARSVDSEGKILLLGNVKNAQDVERVNVALASFKTKIVNLIQVREEESVIGIDVQVLELDRDATNTLGFSWPGATTLTEVGSPGIQAVGTTWGKIFKVSKETRSAFTLTLDALVQEGKARVLSQPRLSCQSGKEAELLVGGEVPILTTSVAATTGATGTNVDYKEFGIKLKIKPIVTEDKRIKLALNVEVSEVGTSIILGSANQPTALAYPLTKRNASTELFLDDGQTMAIGGLKKQKTEEDIRKTPFLGDVPILGGIFRKKTTLEGGGTGERGDVDLFITLTPVIVKETVKKEEAKPEAASSKKEENPAEKAGKETAKKETVKTPAPAVKEPSAVSEYLSKVSQQISASFVYPWAAKQANLEGSVRLELRLENTGRLLDVRVKESSGYSILDENAVSMVKKIAPYPPFPAQMKQKQLRIDLPIVYNAK